jgi:hypothetical protein
VGGSKTSTGAGSPRDAVGATVYITANGMKQRGDVISGGSYMSSNDPRPHFGLGQATKVDDIEIHWPDGKLEHVTVPGVDRIVTITEGTGR